MTTAIYYGYKLILETLLKNFDKKSFTKLEILKLNISEAQKYSGFKISDLLTLIPELQTNLSKEFNKPTREHYEMLAVMHDHGWIELENGIKEKDNHGLNAYLVPINLGGLVMFSVNDIKEIQKKALINVIKEQNIKSKTDLKKYFSEIKSNTGEKEFTEEKIGHVLKLLNEYQEAERKRKTDEYSKKLREQDENLI